MRGNDIINKKEVSILRETKNLEFKEEITNTFLKTVSAYANYGTGKILFGVTDNGDVIGIKDPVKACLNIENKINDSIQPNPNYNLEINDENNVITLTVKQGLNPPYFYKSKAYKRNDSATIPVDGIELSRLILEGENRTFDSLINQGNDYTFQILSDQIFQKLGIDKLSKDLLITLNLYQKDQGYTNAGALLADRNDFRGIDIVRFGETISIILDRENYEKISILDQYQHALEKYRQYYQHEVIQSARREVIEQIPETAYREAVANALVHRTWDVNSQIKISMFEDKIEIISPEGLPQGLSKSEYLSGQISVLRNPILANVFFRLGLIEQLGTGIRRILDAYQKSLVQPQFQIFDNSIKVVLPVIQNSISDLTKDENKIYSILIDKSLSMNEIVKSSGFGRTKALNLINKLIDKGYILRIGQGRGTRYKTAK